LRRVFRAESLGADGAAAALDEPRRSVVVRAAALTWLNPHVYLDTVLLIGSIAATHDTLTDTAVDGRWLFGAGAALASLAWFSGLGFGARVLAPVFVRPRAWQALEVVIAATMILIAAKLALG
jgi:L-lysine exporter family protein LysE/ArgO